MPFRKLMSTLLAVVMSLVLLSLLSAPAASASPGVSAPAVEQLESSSLAPNGSEIVLGAPASVSNQVVLGADWECWVPVIGPFIGIFSTDDACYSTLKPAVEVGCNGIGWVMDHLSDGATQVDCQQIVGEADSWTELAGNTLQAALAPALKAFQYELTAIVRSAAKSINEMVLAEFSSANTITDPVVDCNSVTGVADGLGADDTVCQEGGSTWFVTQFSLMRSVALLLMLPLLMLLVIQSIIRGSLFFLLRSFLVMLPIAVIGTVAVITMTQILINISNELSDAMVAPLLNNGSEYKQAFEHSLDNITAESGGFWGLLWLFIFIFAGLSIFIELLIRNVGIYLATLFLPLAFAALVWPQTSRWTRRLLEILIGLIFSKFFIAAALTLGMSAFAGSQWGAWNTMEHMDETGQNPIETVEGSTGNQTGFQYSASALYAGCSMMIMASFAGARVLSITPSATAKAEQFTSGSKLLSMGALTTTVVGWGGIAMGRYAQRRQAPP